MTMIEGLIGIKIGMSQGFDAEGNVIPVTVITGIFAPFPNAADTHHYPTVKNACQGK